MTAAVAERKGAPTRQWVQAQLEQRIALLNSRNPQELPIDLRYYQVDAITALLNAWFGDGISRQMLVLPTGCGKTVTFSLLAWLIAQWTGRCRTIVLAHREELIDQAGATFRRICFEWSLGKIAKGVVEYGRDVTCAMVPTLGREDKEHRDGWSPKLVRVVARGPYDMVIVDESHHSAADTYLRVLNALQHPQSLRLGVTATPNRADGKALLDVYDQITYSYSIVEAIEDGFLTRPTGVRVHLDINLDDVKVQRSKGGGEKDFADKSLAAKLNTPETRDKCIEAWMQYARERKTIAFACTVEHARDIAKDLRQRGIEAAVVTGETTSEERLRLYRRLRAGEIRVLLSVMVLVEGFDERSVDCVWHIRPTQSWSLFVQTTGRGLRLCKGKEDCLVLDVVGNTQRYSLRGLTMLGGFRIEEVAEAKPVKRDLGPGDGIGLPQQPQQQSLFVNIGPSQQVDLVSVQRAGRFDWTQTPWGHALLLGTVDTGGIFLVRQHNPEKDGLPKSTAGLFKIVHMQRRAELTSEVDAQGGYTAEVVAQKLIFDEAIALAEQEAPRLGAKRGPQGTDTSTIRGVEHKELTVALHDVALRDKQLNSQLKQNIRGAALKPSQAQKERLAKELGLSASILDHPRLTKGEAQKLIAWGNAAGWRNVRIPEWMKQQAPGAQAAAV